MNYKVLSLIPDQGSYLIIKAIRKNYKAIEYALKWNEHLELMALNQVKIKDRANKIILEKVKIVYFSDLNYCIKNLNYNY